VSDTTRGLLKLIDSDEPGPVNLGNPAELTILDLAREILKATASSSTLVFSDLPVDDPQQRCPNIEYAKKVLEWEPMVTLDVGLANTIEFFKSKMGHLADVPSLTE
jgi:nucleoside-diphosphate-sugar epimerase